jgi:hypothetical protein
MSWLGNLKSWNMLQLWSFAFPLTHIMLVLNVKNHARYIIKVIDQFAFRFSCIMLELYVTDHVRYVIKGIDQSQYSIT